jgi:hypothetical protein
MNGLRMYLAIALPLTVLTFIAWYVIFRMTKRRESRKMSATDGNVV